MTIIKSWRYVFIHSSHRVSRVNRVIRFCVCSTLARPCPFSYPLALKSGRYIVIVVSVNQFVHPAPSVTLVSAPPHKQMDGNPT